MVCTLVQATQVRTSKTTHNNALLHTKCFLSVTYFTAWGEGVPKNRDYIFDTTRGKIIVPPLVKLRHVKVVVSTGRQHSRKKPGSGMHSSRYRIVRCFFPRENFFEKYIGGVWMACFVVAVVPDSVAVVCRPSASVRVGT